MTELFARITKKDATQIVTTARKIMDLLDKDAKVTRVNAIRSLIVGIDEAVNEWLLADRQILEPEIKKPEVLSSVLSKRYLENYTGVILLLIDGISTLDIKQKKQLLKDILDTLDKAEKKQKKIIL
jgi:lysophospholipase L1-like esterase